MLPVPHRMMALLNEVLSITAQEWSIRRQIQLNRTSSMKS